MPTMYTPPRVCKVSGCTAPTMSTGWCIAHDAIHNPPKDKGRNRDEKGQERDAFYSTAAWKRIRAAQLSRHTLCMGCMTAGLVRPAKIADHVLAIRFAQELVGDCLNIRALPLQSLCHKCHGEKWSLEKRRTVWDVRTPPGALLSVERFIEQLKATGEWDLVTGETAYRFL